MHLDHLKPGQGLIGNELLRVIERVARGQRFRVHVRCSRPDFLWQTWRDDTLRGSPWPVLENGRDGLLPRQYCCVASDCSFGLARVGSFLVHHWSGFHGEKRTQEFKTIPLELFQVSVGTGSHVYCMRGSFHFLLLSKLSTFAPAPSTTPTSRWPHRPLKLVMLVPPRCGYKKRQKAADSKKSSKWQSNQARSSSILSWQTQAT